jgi:hypothetical protein
MQLNHITPILERMQGRHSGFPARAYGKYKEDRRDNESFPLHDDLRALRRIAVSSFVRALGVPEFHSRTVPRTGKLIRNTS